MVLTNFYDTLTCTFPIVMLVVGYYLDSPYKDTELGKLYLYLFYAYIGLAGVTVLLILVYSFRLFNCECKCVRIMTITIYSDI